MTEKMFEDYGIILFKRGGKFTMLGISLGKCAKMRSRKNRQCGYSKANSRPIMCFWRSSAHVAALQPNYSFQRTRYARR